MKFGIDLLLEHADLRKPLAGRRVALLAHPASVTANLVHSLDALAAIGGIRLTAAFGPQHGLRGDKQDNMVESPDFIDPALGIPVFSLYGEVRRPTPAMMDSFDILLVDLQDLGCRIYTFITTLRYVLEEAAKHGKCNGCCRFKEGEMVINKVVLQQGTIMSNFLARNRATVDANTLGKINQMRRGIERGFFAGGLEYRSK